MRSYLTIQLFWHSNPTEEVIKREFTSSGMVPRVGTMSGFIGASDLFNDDREKMVAYVPGLVDAIAKAMSLTNPGDTVYINLFVSDKVVGPIDNDPDEAALGLLVSGEEIVVEPPRWFTN